MRPVEPPVRLSLPRRELLRLLAGLAAWLPAPWLLAGLPGTPRAAPSALGPLLDTLLPAGVAPAATELGVDTALMAEAGGNPNLARLLELGCAWLDRQAAQFAYGTGFAGLAEAQRVAIVEAAEAAPARSLPRVLFAAVRDRAFHHYYAEPRAWAHLRYPGPPQPVGFPGHDGPPGDAP